MPAQKPAMTSGYLSAEPPLCQRERSTSAPNVSFNLVNLNGTNETILGLTDSTVVYEQSDPTSGYHSLSTTAEAATSYKHRPSVDSNTLGPPLTDQERAIQSVSGSPNAAASLQRNWRPRARSADESAKKKIRNNAARDSMEDWEIPANQILVGKQIGSGSFGTVYYGTYHGPVALKKLKVKKPTKEQLLVSLSIVVQNEI